MLRFGNISSIDADKGRARVSFPDDGIVSGWLPLVVTKALKDKHYYMPDINEPVACLMDENLEDGVILGAIYNGKTAPGGSKGADITSIEFEDGTLIEYDRSASKLTLKCAGKVEIETTEAEIKGPLKVTGSITANGEVTARATSLNVSLSTHNHPTAPPGPVSPPTPGT
jgi:phage baseplate assembly protein V